jgi:ammonia channel protein AmtB
MKFPFKIHAKAVVIGLVSGFILGILVGPLETLLTFGASLSATPLHIVSLTLGSLATVFAAYLTARKAPTDKLANVLIFWTISELLGILSTFVLPFPVWYNLVGALSIFVASLLGWYLEKLAPDAI